jgi:hypothetical protein
MKKGWERKTLGEICVVDWGNTDLTKSAYVEGGKFLAVSAAGCDGRIEHKKHAKHATSRIKYGRRRFGGPSGIGKGDPVTTRTDRQFLKVQILETQRLQKLTAGHPLMSHALSVREQELSEQVRALPLGKKEPRAVLFFTGEPVTGCLGIDAAFAAGVMEPFQKMVAADFAYRRLGRVGGRGGSQSESHSRMMLSGLPRASFGLELTAAANDDLFAKDELADSLSHVTRVVDASVRSDEDFASELTETSPRVVQCLKLFLEVIAKGRAGLRLESGDLRTEMTPEQASRAFERVSETQSDEETVSLTGTFKGVLLESWEFNFTKIDRESIKGKIGQELSEDQVIEFNTLYFNQRCIATLLKTTVSFKNGRNRVTYQLQNVDPSSA